MPPTTHIAGTLHFKVNRLLERLRRWQGFTEDVVGYTGYGASGEAGDVVRVFGRVVLVDPDVVGGAAADASATESELDDAQHSRGWRNFLGTPAVFAPVSVTVGDATRTTSTDWSGYLDVELHGHGLDPGWHRATITCANGTAIRADIRIFNPQATVGIVSDIDDTVLVTLLPRPLLAFWNTFMRSEVAREPVPGMAALGKRILLRFPNAPVVYLSTGSWSIAPVLVRFLRRHGFPAGPLLLTDWAPTNTGWFRSGQDHKRRSLERLHREFPDVEWILVGDDGQHDPLIYRAFAQRHPESVRAIAIRTLTTAEQVFSHGFPGPKEALPGPNPPVPVLYGRDGHALEVVLADYDADRYGPTGAPFGPAGAATDDGSTSGLSTPDAPTNASAGTPAS
ncbi:MAG TPA: phosphatase domain-containing protein [Nitriliruptoraceae bacterium]|nr:phosphatase domain-containing protein [Nitriliruptoraceae bacterium]